jgi:cytochrome c oxidase subunit IV
MPEHVEKSETVRYVWVYICILILAGLQFLIGYSHLSILQKFILMLIVAVSEAALGVLFFMHLWAEKRWFIVVVAVVTVFVLISLQYSWPDSFRLLSCGGKCS